MVASGKVRHFTPMKVVLMAMLWVGGLLVLAIICENYLMKHCRKMVCDLLI